MKNNFNYYTPCCLKYTFDGTVSLLHMPIAAAAVATVATTATATAAAAAAQYS